jgi:hypothetical protein
MIIGGTSGMVTDDLETFRLDKLESEVFIYIYIYIHYIS